MNLNYSKFRNILNVFFFGHRRKDSKGLSGDGQSLKEPVFPPTTSLKGILRYSYVFHSFLRGTGTRRVMAHKHRVIHSFFMKSTYFNSRLASKIFKRVHRSVRPCTVICRIEPRSEEPFSFETNLRRSFSPPI